MTEPVTPQAEPAIADIARRHGLSRESVLAMLVALRAGGGTMAQFNIPELGGSGQWMRGGMTMVGDMFDNALKARVDALCHELAQLMSTTPVFAPTTAASPGAFPSADWWPDGLGVPSSTGGQNDTRYAVFPAARRLAIHFRGVTRVFDTAEHQIGGVAQQQGGGGGSVMFTSQFGTFDVSNLREIGAEPPAAAPTGGSTEPAAVIAAIESLAGLHERGILSDEEFATKKAELLARL
jgi:hypothetical protein